MLFEVSRDQTTYAKILSSCRELLGYDPQIETTLSIFRVFCKSADCVSLLAGCFA